MDAVLLCGGYGVGKTTICEEIADAFEEADAAFAAIDLDWLAWGRYGDGGRAAEMAMLTANLRSVVGNYLAAGVQRFVLAWSARDRQEVDALSDALGMPLRVVELTAPSDEVNHRLGHALTSGRARYVEVAAQWRRSGVGSGFADAIIPNVGEPRAVAVAVLRALGWPLGPARRLCT